MSNRNYFFLFNLNAHNIDHPSELISIVSFYYIWFDSFVQEFVAAPLDGVSLLLEVLRSIQLSQQNGIGQTNTTGKMNAQTYQRRALLDELASLYVKRTIYKKKLYRIYYSFVLKLWRRD